MITPTADEIRSWAPPAFDWDRHGLGDAFGSETDPLDSRISWAAGELYAVTGRTLASITVVEEVAIAQRVLVAFTITQAVGGGAAALNVMEKPWLKAFTAGSYSETRFSPSELAGGRTNSPPYPGGLWALLWALMTPEKQDEWMFRLSGERAPAGTFVEVDWSGGADVGPLIWGPGIQNW
jgi:hypothetical protein